MQNTRLSTLIDRIFQQFTQWAENPWRRLSLIIISLLFGNFLASAVATSSGQRTDLDIITSLTLVVGVELTSWLTYGTIILGPRPILIAILNNIKIGLIYGLFVEAFKLGS
jgi:Protein of unknown function (DUF565)